jgi:UDP-GlcNAc3NAcA epimerase
MKLMTIVGTRPEFIQTSPLTKAIRKRHTEILVNTGQHYDDNMSRIFFEELEIPLPEINLDVGSGSHAQQTGQIMMRMEAVMLREQPDWVIVHGDTNSTIAGALTAAKLHIPIAHVEAGLRSYDRRMPEEINRVVTDHVSTLVFAPTETAVKNLAKEGITDKVRLVGHVRTDLLLAQVDRARAKFPALKASAGLTEGKPFALMTIHRASNTDEKDRLSAIVETLSTLDMDVVLPAHPRLRKMLDNFGLTFSQNVKVIDPVGFLEVLALLDACEIVITDSGGLQMEAYIMKRPAVTVRDTTEWIETVHSGWNRLCEPDVASFKAAVDAARSAPPAVHPDHYGTPGVSDRIIDALEAMRNQL